MTIDNRALRLGLYRLWVLTIKELIQLRRDKMLMIFVVYAFSIDPMIAGSGLKMELTNAALAVIDQDHTPRSRELIYRFREPEFALKSNTNSPYLLQKMLDRGDVMIAMTIPPNFSKNIAAGQMSSVQLLVDTSNVQIGSLATSYAAVIIGQYGLDQAMQRLRFMGLGGGGGGSLPMVEAVSRNWFNPNAVDQWFVPITELMTIVTMLSIVLPAAAMVREKERGTVEQLLVSPLSPMQIMFPKVIAMTLVILLGVTVAVYGVLMPVFDVPFRGSYLLFYLLTAVYVFTSAGFGLAIATVTRNLAQVGLVVLMFLGPMLLLSGTWTPPEALPVVIQKLMLLSPLHYFVDIVFGIMLKGVGLKILWPTVLQMLILGMFVFGFGLVRFRRQFGA